MKPQSVLIYGSKFRRVRDGKTFTLKKYWDDDVDPTSFKIKLCWGVPFHHETFYSCDFESLVEKGFYVATGEFDMVYLNDLAYFDVFERKGPTLKDNDLYMDRYRFWDSKLPASL